MKTSTVIIIINIFISTVLLLNALATEIEHGEAIREANRNFGEVRTAAELQGYDAEADAEVPEIVTETPDYVTAIARNYGLVPAVVKAIIEIESGGNPKAVGDDGEAIGLMQIHPAWHSDRMEKLGVTDLTHPAQNVLVGCDILAELLAEYGDYHYNQILQAYNSGSPTGAPEYAEQVMKYAEKLWEESRK